MTDDKNAPILNDTAQLLAAMSAMGAMSETPRKVFIRGLGWVYVREITIGEIDDQLADQKKAANGSDAEIKWTAARGATRLLCNQIGVRLLDPDNAEHVAKMAILPLRVLTAINETQEETAKGN